MKKFKQILLIIALSITLFNPSKVYAHGEHFAGPFLLNCFTGYQCGVSNNGLIIHGFDSNLIFLFVNGSYSYKFNYGSKAYFGVGFGSLLQLQYGYEFPQEKDLLRVRTDIPLTVYNTDGFWCALGLGVYFEYRFNAPDYSFDIGISISYGLTNLYWSPY